MCVYENNIFGQDFKDSDVNIFYFIPSYFPVIANGFLQNFLTKKYFHQAAGILADFEHFFLVFSRHLGLR